MKVNFRRLMQIYTVILIFFGMVLTGIGIATSLANSRSSLKQAENMATQRASESIARNQQVTDDLSTNITSDPRRLNNISHYFTLSPAQYANYAIAHSQGDAPYYNWPNESHTFMMQHPEVRQMYLTLLRTNGGTAFVATRQQKEGTLKKIHAPAPDFYAALINPTTASMDGIVGLDFDNRVLDQQLREIEVRGHLQVLVLNSDHTVLNHFSDATVTKQERRQVSHAVAAGSESKLHGYTMRTRDLDNGFQIRFFVNQEGMRQQLFEQVSGIALLGVTVLLILSVILWLMFGSYRRQLNAILHTVEAVGKGNMKARVPANVKQADLAELSQGINRMLGDIDDYIYAIYQLRIAQQDANIKALQAQINPHFMSNTLEYIRMAALDADQPELAKVVYSFAALLRNNTDFSPLTTIKKELDFIDKYVFLYQVRFPDRLAYQITVDPTIAELEIPKFSFQPLVENYFVHGVDFGCGDNALRIKARRDQSQITITIANNGKPLTAEEITKLNQRMKKPLGVEQAHSIGLQNVYSRLRDYFGSSFAMWLSSDGAGVTVTIQFNEQKAGKTSEEGGHADAAGHDR